MFHLYPPGIVQLVQSFYVGFAYATFGEPRRICNNWNSCLPKECKSICQTHREHIKTTV